MGLTEFPDTELDGGLLLLPSSKTAMSGTAGPTRWIKMGYMSFGRRGQIAEIQMISEKVGREG